jgi:hypothetical protein
MNEKETIAASAVMRDEIKSLILKKIDAIREKVVLETGSHKDSYLQMLLMVSEDLDDVLLNWEYDSINPKFDFLRDLEDFDDED